MITFPICLSQLLRQDETLRRSSSRRLATVFTACWHSPTVLHWRVPVAVLQESVPYPVDTWDGYAWVSVAAYSLEKIVWHNWLLKRIFGGPYRLLDIQTCVRVHGRTGIYLLSEWCQGGPVGFPGSRWFDLPSRRAKISYQSGEKRWEATVRHPRWGTLQFSVIPVAGAVGPAPADTLDEFLLERRYLAFTFYDGRAGWFRRQHHPWHYRPVAVDLQNVDLLRRTENWFGYASFSHAVQADSLHHMSFSEWKRLRLQDNLGFYQSPT